MSRAALSTITVALQRFWIGDSHGAIYTLLPMIETLIRDFIVNVNHGMYRLQQTHAPGQYPGLGAMLDLLPDFYDISPGWQRALKTILTHPAGFNLRNRLSHGIEQYSDPGHAALAIHTAFWLATLTPKPPGLTFQTRRAERQREPVKRKEAVPFPRAASRGRQ